MAPLKSTAARRGRDERPAAPGASSGDPNGAGRARFPWLAVALLALFVVASYPYGWSLPFLNDDYVILDKTRTASFASLWAPRNLLFNWYRPLSREFHYWAAQRLFGFDVTPYHVTSAALWLACFASFVALARRVAGTRVALFAAAAVAALAAWGAPLLWVAGVQELWLLFYAFLFLHLFARRRDGWALVPLAAALLSKETAGVLPALALAWALLVDHDRPGVALRRVVPQLAVCVPWALLHPRILGRLWGPYRETFETVHRPALHTIAARTLLALVNLEERPAPESGAARALLGGALGIAALVALALWAMRSPAPAVAADTRRGAPQVAALGACWAVLGLAPLFLPSISWHAYYVVFGAFGVWLAIAWWLRGRPALFVAIVATLAILRPLRADTPSWDWASDAYQRRAGFFLEHLRDDLLRQHPTLPHHARLYFSQVPQNIGFVAGDGPALRIWYRDSTLLGGYYSDFRPRPPGSPGDDRFFRFDGSLGWVEVTKGAEPIDSAQAANPNWEQDHRELARLLGGAGDWPGAVIELAKLASARPDQLEYPLNAGVACERAGDSTGAAGWYARAAALPGADDEIRARARRFKPYLRGAPPGR